MSARNMFAYSAPAGARIPDDMRLIAFARRGEEVRTESSTLVPQELDEKYRWYIVRTEACSFRYAVSALITCTIPNGSEFKPGANGMMALRMSNARGLRRLLDKLKWPQQIAYGDVYCALKPEFEEQLRKTVAEAGPKGLQPYEEWLKIIPSSSELNEKAEYDTGLIFDHYGLRLIKNTLTIDGIAPVLAK